MFITNVCRSEGWTKWTHPRTERPYTLSLKGAPSLTAAELAACFALIEKTSGGDYRASSVGWSPSKKKVEMKSPELRYILVSDEEGSLRGFVSLMPTWEEGEPVVYCYEIHLEEDLRGFVLFSRPFSSCPLGLADVGSAARGLPDCSWGSSRPLRPLFHQLRKSC